MIWSENAPGIPPTKRLSLRRKMAEAVGNAPFSIIVSFPRNVGSGGRGRFNLHDNALWAEAVQMERWDEDLEKCWRKQVWKTASWKQVRGPAGAVVCATRDSGIGFPSWHALLFEEGVIVDVKAVCPQDVKNMVKRLAKQLQRKGGAPSVRVKNCKMEFGWRH